MCTAIILIMVAAAFCVALVLSRTVFTGGENGLPSRYFDSYSQQFDQAGKEERQIPKVSEIQLKALW
ncbi:MAG: hypothetical protein CVU64_22730 [Deltaproteobacteria bacterium HGW-Deltaproteobacteria-21]|nr:MAG: hypothetical protein CVU64_22730 [Deltaproteobacteria bacterium HGW-Deltaproteobacteria-21]